MQKFLPSVVEYSEGHRVIVADNASTDGSVELLRKEFPQVEVLQLPENLGFAGGYNEALKLISAPYYLLLNSDVEVTPGWISPMLRLLESFPEMAACQPGIRSYHQRDYFEYAGAAGGYIDSLGYPFCRGRIFDTLEPDQGQYHDTVPVFWASGACMLIKAEVFKKAGGFDASFFAHMEEIDLCWRIYRLGYTIYVCPESIVYHVGGGTLSKSNPRKTYLNFRNSLRMLYKNSPPFGLLWKLPCRIGLDLLAAVAYALKGQTGNSWAVLKAQGAFWSSLPDKTQFHGKGMEGTPAFRGSILWEYYVKGKKRFNKLKFPETEKGKIQKAL